MCLYWLLHGCSEDCECIVVVTWTRQLFLRLPFAISLPYSPITTVVCNQVSHSVVKLTNRFYRINSFTSPRKCVHMKWIHSHEGNVNTWRNYVHVFAWIKGSCSIEGIVFTWRNYVPMCSHEGNAFTWRKCVHMKEMRPHEGNATTRRKCVHVKELCSHAFTWRQYVQMRDCVQMKAMSSHDIHRQCIHMKWIHPQVMKEICSNEGNLFKWRKYIHTNGMCSQP